MQGKDSVLVSENMYIYLNNLLCHHSCEEKKLNFKFKIPISMADFGHTK